MPRIARSAIPTTTVGRFTPAAPRQIPVPCGRGKCKKRMQKLELTWVGKRCEFDKTDYALNIVAAPAEDEEE